MGSGWNDYHLHVVSPLMEGLKYLIWIAIQTRLRLLGPEGNRTDPSLNNMFLYVFSGLDQ
jgi:hypothetical protein